MNPLLRGILGMQDPRPQTQENHDREDADGWIAAEETVEEQSQDSKTKVGVLEWVWFIAWGLLLPMLFFLFYGFVGLLVGLVLFGIYLLLVYISVKPESERQGLEEKAERLQNFVDQRKDYLSRFNQKTIESVQRSVIRNIPGFRSRTPWKMIIATGFYLFTILILFVAVQQGSYGLALVIGLTALLFVSGTQDEMS
jgi:ABC-type multidrug transport system fused ATPase/permease subunit